MRDDIVENRGENVELPNQNETITNTVDDDVIPVWVELINKLKEIPGVKSMEDLEEVINKYFDGSLTEAITGDMFSEILSVTRSIIDKQSLNNSNASCVQLLDIIKKLPTVAPKTKRRGRLV